MEPRGLQETFLNALRKSGTPTTFFLVNGFQMKGVVKAYDQYTLILESGGQQKLVFKHALSTLIPDTVIEWQC